MSGKWLSHWRRNRPSPKINSREAPIGIHARTTSGGHMTSVCRMALLALVAAPLLAAPAGAQQPTGAELLATKCLQCHTQAMWQDQRQDTRAWEANLYRMVGRGALWSTQEIKLMSEYLGANFGPTAPR